MKENVKTGILWFLIISSVVLTYLIWTYQPSVGIIEEAEYYDSDRIGEERQIVDVIKPREIIVHQDGQSYFVPSIEKMFYDILEVLQNNQYGNFTRSSNVEAPSLYKQMEGIEIVFPDRIKEEWIKYLLGMEAEDYFPLQTVDRINLFLSGDADEIGVTVRFFSYLDEEMYETNIDVSERNFDALYANYRDEMVEVLPITFSTSEVYFTHVRYVPTERISLPEYTYYSGKLSQEIFKQFLFPDPEFVKRYFQGNFEETFTDGSRMINIVENGEILRYIHASGGPERSEDDTTILRASVDFINSHAGWTDDYYMSRWQEMPTNERINYRLHVNDLPVMAANSFTEEYYMKEVIRNNGQITDYNRSLLQFTEEVFTTNVGLPTYDEITVALESDESFATSDIDDIQIGYYMRRQDSFVILEPSWFVRDRGSWRQVVPLEEEAGASGLE